MTTLNEPDPMDRYLIAAHDAWAAATGDYAPLRGMRAAVEAVVSMSTEKRWACARCGRLIAADEGEYRITNQKHHGTDQATFQCKEHTS